MKALMMIMMMTIGMAAQANDGKIVKQELYASGTVKMTVVDKGDGILEMVSYYENGMIRQKGEFYNNVKHGLWLGYAQNGTKTGEVNYANGTPVGVRYVWDSEGKLIGSVDYKSNEVAAH